MFRWFFPIHLSFFSFAGKGRLEICRYGVGSLVFMAVHNSRGRWNSWHHFTSTNIIRYPCTDRYNNVSNSSKTTYSAANLIIDFEREWARILHLQQFSMQPNQLPMWQPHQHFRERNMWENYCCSVQVFVYYN